MKLGAKLASAEVSWIWFAALGASLLGFVAMASSLFGPFLFDDIPLILGNSRVHSFEHWQQLLTGDLWDTSFAGDDDARHRGFWRPLIQFSYAFNWVLSAGDPFWFHLTNLCVHAANAALLLFALRRWLADDVAATVGAALFALHPVQTESVAWIAGRTDLFCCLGLLITAHAFAGRLRGIRWMALLEAFGILVALGSKESFVLLPVLSALEVWAFLGRSPPSRSMVMRYVESAAPHLVVVALYLIGHQLLVRVEPLALGVTAYNRVPLFLEAWGRYTALVLWPDDLTLGRALFSFEKGAIVANPAFAVLGMVTLACFGWAVWRWRRAGAASVALCCYVGLTLPVSSLLWLDYDVLVSPRFLYIPMIAVAMLAAQLLVAGRAWHRSWARVALGLVLAVLGTRSFIRAYDFADEQRFWQREISMNPRYTSAQIYFVVREVKDGRPRAALRVAHAAFRRLSSDRDIELARAHLVVPTLTALLLMTPDLAQGTLQQVARFASDIRERKAGRLELPILAADGRSAPSGLFLHLPKDSVLGRALYGARHRLRVLEADAYSRLGQSERVLRTLRPVIEECGRCWQELKSAIPVAVRAEQLGLARELVEKAERWAPTGALEELAGFVQNASALRGKVERSKGSPRSRVAFLSFAGAYGEAYRIARVEYARAPSRGLTRTLAELAVLAGDDKSALEYLSALYGRGPELEQRIVQLKLVAGRVDQPRPEGHWLPEL